MRHQFLSFVSLIVLGGCGGGSASESNGGGGGSGSESNGGGGGALTGGGGTGGGAATGGSSGSNGATGGDASTGGSNGATGGSPPTGPIACSPDISERMVPCEGTPAQVPTLTKSFSITGPFAAGESVAISVQASSGLGMTVQAFSEQSACEGPGTTIGEVVIPNGDYSCAEVTVPDAVQAVRFELLDDSVTYPALHAACGGCP